MPQHCLRFALRRSRDRSRVSELEPRGFSSLCSLTAAEDSASGSSSVGTSAAAVAVVVVVTAAAVAVVPSLATTGRGLGLLGCGIFLRGGRCGSSAGCVCVVNEEHERGVLAASSVCRGDILAARRGVSSCRGSSRGERRGIIRSITYRTGGRLWLVGGLPSKSCVGGFVPRGPRAANDRRFSSACGGSDMDVPQYLSSRLLTDSDVTDYSTV